MTRITALALLAGLGALPLSGCSTMAGVPLAGDMTPEAAPAYVAMAASSDMYEITSSQIALQRARDPRHRSFAQMMIQHHTGTTAQLTAAARSAGLNPPPAMLPMHAALIRQLQASSNVDATYHQQQVLAHQQALALHSNYASRGDQPALRSVAAAATPIVQSHLTQIRSFSM